MTDLMITPDIAKKRMRISGRVAAGEKVAVTLVGFGDRDTTTTRLRIVFMNTVIAILGGGDSVAWETDGNDLTGILNLNTVEAEKVTQCCDANCLFILDDVSENVRQLYATAEHEVAKWVKMPGADSPINLDGYADILAETRAEIDGFKDSVSSSIENYRTEIGNAFDSYRNAMNTRADQFDAEIRATTTANSIAINAEVDARTTADTELSKLITVVSANVGKKQDALTSNQLNAVNSGINSEKVAQISSNAATIARHEEAIELNTNAVAQMILKDAFSAFDEIKNPSASLSSLKATLIKVLNALKGLNA